MSFKSIIFTASTISIHTVLTLLGEASRCYGLPLLFLRNLGHYLVSYKRHYFLNVRFDPRSGFAGVRVVHVPRRTPLATDPEDPKGGCVQIPFPRLNFVQIAVYHLYLTQILFQR